MIGRRILLALVAIAIICAAGLAASLQQEVAPDRYDPPEPQYQLSAKHEHHVRGGARHPTHHRADRGSIARGRQARTALSLARQRPRYAY
jgi:hypothetical protein